MFSTIGTALMVTIGVACYYLIARRRLEGRAPQAQIIEILLVTSALLALVYLPSLGMTALLLLSSAVVFLLAGHAIGRWVGREATAGDLLMSILRPNAELLQSGALILLGFAFFVPFVLRSPLVRSSLAPASSSGANLMIYVISGALLAQAAVVYIFSTPVEIRERGIVSAWRCMLWKEIDRSNWQVSSETGREDLVVRSGSRIFQVAVPSHQVDELREWLEQARNGATSLSTLESGQRSPEISNEDAPLSSPVERSGS